MRWALRLLSYSFKIKHIPGITNPADYFSRKPISEEDLINEGMSPQQEAAEEFVNRIIMDATPKSIPLQTIIFESGRDKELQDVVKRLNDRQWHRSPELKAYERIKDEFLDS